MCRNVKVGERKYREPLISKSNQIDVFTSTIDHLREVTSPSDAQLPTHSVPPQVPAPGGNSNFPHVKYNITREEATI